MNIDSMYEAGAVGLLFAAKKKRTEAWMAYMAFWLGRQQIYNLQSYWLALGARIFVDLSDEEKEALEPQLSKEEDKLIAAAGDWPEMPERLNDLLPLSTKKGKSEDSLEVVQERLLRRIDAEATSNLPEWPGPQRAAIRATKLEQARAKLANSSISDKEVPYVVADSVILGISKVEAAENIIKRAEADEAVNLAVETKRRAARKAVVDAKTVEEASAAATVEWSS